MTAGSVSDWYQFLDVTSAQEAVWELRRFASRLDIVREELETVCRTLSYTPDSEIYESLWITRISLGDAIEHLEDVAMRFPAAENQSA